MATAFKPQAVPAIDWSKGDRAAMNELMPAVYDELRRLARRYLRSERPDHTLQTTALVHEAYLRLVNEKNATWHNRVSFFAVAAQLMRHILVDYARSHNAAKRGHNLPRLSLDDAMAASPESLTDLLLVDELLSSLTAIDEQQGRVVELLIFGGLTVEETAEALGVSPRTIKREWSMAKAWLHSRLKVR